MSQCLCGLLRCGSAGDVTTASGARPTGTALGNRVAPLRRTTVRRTSFSSGGVMTPLAKGTETEPIPACAKRLVYINSNLIMENRDNSALWRALTPVQRSLLARLDRDGPLLTLRPWEMRTVRSLLGRGLVRPRPPGRDGCAEAGLWILSAKGRRILPNRVHIADVSSPEPPWEGESAPSRAAGRQPRSGMGASPFGAPGTTGRAAP